MKRNIKNIICMIVALFTLSACEHLAKPEPQACIPAAVEKPRARTLGWVEYVSISPGAPLKKAKLDTGATTSSINSEIVRKFKKDGKQFVVFRVYFDEEKYETFEAPVERWVRIRLRSGEGEFDRRPVVKMTFCVDGMNISGEVNLAERNHFIYPILIGRNMLENRIIVDAGRTYLAKNQCKGPEAE